MNWIIENKEWLFSGIGVTIALALLSFFWKKKKKLKRTGIDNSINQTLGEKINSKNGNVDFKENTQIVNIKK